MYYKGVAKEQLGCLWHLPFVNLFKQTTFNRCGGEHDNLVSTLTLTECDPPLKNPCDAPVLLSVLSDFFHCILMYYCNVQSKISYPNLPLMLLNLYSACIFFVQAQEMMENCSIEDPNNDDKILQCCLLFQRKGTEMKLFACCSFLSLT